MPIKEFKIVEIGNYVCAIKLGRCPIFAVEHLEKKKDMIEGLKFDFPDHIFVNGGKKERAEAAKRIIMQKNMNAGR